MEAGPPGEARWLKLWLRSIGCSILFAFHAVNDGLTYDPLADTGWHALHFSARLFTDADCIFLCREYNGEKSLSASFVF
jgi:hypothetical protein